jgi:hypothetical protein
MWADGDGTADKKVNNPGKFLKKYGIVRTIII